MPVVARDDCGRGERCELDAPPNREDELKSLFFLGCETAIQMHARSLGDELRGHREGEWTAPIGT